MTTVKYLLLFHFVQFSLQITLEPILERNCSEARDIFANSSSEFIKCSIEYSRPITFCENCVKQYINVIKSYNNMSKISINETSCLNNLVNLDRLGIIEIIYENNVNLWNRAKCYECFQIVNGTQTDSVSNETIQFSSLYNDFYKCLNNTSDNQCSECSLKYDALQNYFFSISNENEKIGVCMDIVDQMNTTWTYWGNKCCKYRRHNEYLFLSSSIMVLLCTVLFYVISQICAKKKLPTIIEQTRFLSSSLET